MIQPNKLASLDAPAEACSGFVGLLGAALLCGGCSIAVPPLDLNDGLKREGDVVSLDATKVPVLPACGPGTYVRRSAAGDSWECGALPAVWPGTLPWARVTEPPDVGALQQQLVDLKARLDAKPVHARVLLAAGPQDAQVIPRCANPTEYAECRGLYAPLGFGVVKSDANGMFKQGRDYNPADGTWAENPRFEVPSDGLYLIECRVYAFTFAATPPARVRLVMLAVTSEGTAELARAEQLAPPAQQESLYLSSSTQRVLISGTQVSCALSSVYGPAQGISVYGPTDLTSATITRLGAVP